MGGDKQKYELTIPKADAGEFFTSLGQGLQNGCLSLGENELELDNLTEFKLSLKVYGDSFLVKIKTKSEVPYAAPGDAAGQAMDAQVHACATTGAEVKPKYKSLKKRMKKPWKMILEALQAGTMPDAGLVQSFVRDSELMVTYPGKGDEFYGAYRVGLERFASAYEAGDQQAAADAAAALERLKKACHDRYD